MSYIKYLDERKTFETIQKFSHGTRWFGYGKLRSPEIVERDGKCNSLEAAMYIAHRLKNPNVIYFEANDKDSTTSHMIFPYKRFFLRDNINNIQYNAFNKVRKKYSEKFPSNDFDSIARLCASYRESFKNMGMNANFYWVNLDQLGIRWNGDKLIHPTDFFESIDKNKNKIGVQNPDLEKVIYQSSQ